jgi:hypothetical protein
MLAPFQVGVPIVCEPPPAAVATTTKMVALLPTTWVKVEDELPVPFDVASTEIAANALNGAASNKSAKAMPIRFV